VATSFCLVSGLVNHDQDSSHKVTCGLLLWLHMSASTGRSSLYHPRKGFGRIEITMCLREKILRYMSLLRLARVVSDLNIWRDTVFLFACSLAFYVVLECLQSKINGS
jgi:hypothetical protein